MPRWPRLVGLFLMTALVLPSLAADDKDVKKDDPPKKKEAAKKDDDTPKKKGADKEKEPAEKEKKDKFAWGMELVGKINVDGNSQRDFTLHVTQKTLEPDYGAQQQYGQQQVQLVQQQLRMATARTPQDRLRATQQYYQTAMQLAQTQQRLFRPKDINYDVQLRFAEDMKVRLMQPPIDYDDKGNVKKYTAKELQDLRGKEGLPGYGAEMDAIRSGQIVAVYLSRKALPNQAAKAKAGGKAPAAKGAKKKADDEVDEVGPARPEAVMIMVLRDVLPNQ
jgi:hypothetical protein